MFWLGINVVYHQNLKKQVEDKQIVVNQLQSLLNANQKLSNQVAHHWQLLNTIQQARASLHTVISIHNILAEIVTPAVKLTAFEQNTKRQLALTFQAEQLQTLTQLVNQLQQVEAFKSVIIFKITQVSEAAMQQMEVHVALE